MSVTGVLKFVALAKDNRCPRVDSMASRALPLRIGFEIKAHFVIPADEPVYCTISLRKALRSRCLSGETAPVFFPLH